MFWEVYSLEYFINAPIQDDFIEVFNYLRKIDIDVTFVTKRSKDFGNLSYKIMKMWLKDLTNTECRLIHINEKDNKGIICRQEKITVLVDDHLNNLLDAKNEGIIPIYFNQFNLENKYNFLSVQNWLELKEQIIKLL